MTGVIVTIVQIIKTKKISDAAYLAARDAKAVITNTIVISNFLK
jgi:hypothetical protein